MSESPTNTRCLKCGHEWYVMWLSSAELGSITCPACKHVFSEEHVECWTQTVWPYPLCPSCKKWGATKRPCTMPSLGECDCPKCQGLCTCGAGQ